MACDSTMPGSGLDKVIRDITQEKILISDDLFFTDEFKRSLAVVRQVQRILSENEAKRNFNYSDIEIRPYAKSDADGFRLRWDANVWTPVVIVHGNVMDDGVSVITGLLHKLDYGGQYFKKEDWLSKDSFEVGTDPNEIANFVVRKMFRE